MASSWQVAGSRVRGRPLPLRGPRLDCWDAGPRSGQFGVGYLPYGLIDNIVDDHFAAVQSLDDAIESLEDQVFADIFRRKDWL